MADQSATAHTADFGAKTLIVLPMRISSTEGNSMLSDCPEVFTVMER